MMATLGAMDRTEQQIRELLEGVGFRILHIWRPKDVESECMIKVIAKETYSSADNLAYSKRIQFLGDRARTHFRIQNPSTIHSIDIQSMNSSQLILSEATQTHYKPQHSNCFRYRL